METIRSRNLEIAEQVIKGLIEQGKAKNINVPFPVCINAIALHTGTTPQKAEEYLNHLKPKFRTNGFEFLKEVSS